MLRDSMLLGTTLALACTLGCAPTSEQRNQAFELRKVSQERDGLRQQLDTELAKNAALRKRVSDEVSKVNTSLAQANASRDYIEKLTQRNNELQTLLAERAQRPIERPAVPASPLPEQVDEALQTFANKSGQRVWYDRGRGAIGFANERLFELGSDAVRADAHAALHELADVLASESLASHEIIILGHTDPSPITKPETLARHPSNWHLSVHRAIAVKDVLVKAGLRAARLGVMGYAHYRPVGDDPAQNRRVEIFIVPKGGIQPFQPVRPQ